MAETDLKTAIQKIWKAINDLDKADVQTTALAHTIITLLIEKGFTTQKQIVEFLPSSFEKAKEMRKDISQETVSVLDADSAWEFFKTVQ